MINCIDFTVTDDDDDDDDDDDCQFHPPTSIIANLGYNKLQ